MKKVVHWSTKDVLLWLTNVGMQEYSEALRHLNGKGLMQLSKADFQTAPLALVTLDGGRQLLDKMETLRIEHHIETHKNRHANGHAILAVNSEVNGNKPERNGVVNEFHKERIQIPMPEITRSPFPEEWGKTGVAFVYATICFIFTTIMISVVHERVPAKEATPPLPDKFFDFFGRVDWAFSICEINGMILIVLWLLQWALLKYRSIVGRRFFFIIGTLYLYRCITMYITTLPVPGMHFKCSPKVLKELEVKYGILYRQDNVILSGTHTHSGLGGYFQYTLFMITSKGYIKPSIKAIVNGIVKSIDIAHRNIKPGRIYMSKGELEESNLNRSPHSYLNNPAEERNKYKSNTDKQVTLLKFTDLDGDGMGMLSWFAVHAVSMNYTNQMVSSDNMGYASYLLEQEKNIGFLPGEGPFVAAFASSNLGDASPNIRGPFCANTGLPCDYLNSSCPIGGLKMCVALGPAGSDMFNNTKIIGENIFKRAKDLYGKARQEVRGPLHAAHQWVNMTDVTVQLNSTHTSRTCKPALGHSFAAGTTDGGGDLNFTQGAVEGDPFWDGIRDALLGAPSNETQDCHQPKPILFSTGEMTWPLPWHPSIVDVQIITIGPVAIVAIPGEMTTMSGRRIREAVKQVRIKYHTHTNVGTHTHARAHTPHACTPTH
ncbi:unnamed protein product [Oncorhynchus mykiss]|uniref:Neutral ceramidase n=1 Tax=Oncorhynchus mykiss TaxID=8022 RepID=A0A060YVJ7_ONCMY|nr:unnamed protein product [Oncorhynchus mykiss]